MSLVFLAFLDIGPTHKPNSGVTVDLHLPSQCWTRVSPCLSLSVFILSDKHTPLLLRGLKPAGVSFLRGLALITPNPLDTQSSNTPSLTRKTEVVVEPITTRLVAAQVALTRQ